MNDSIFSCFPIIFLIAGVLITKKVTGMLFLSVLIASLMIDRLHFLQGFIRLLYQTLSSSNFQFILLLIVGMGAFIKIYEVSGVLNGLEGIISKAAASRKRALLLTWFMSAVLFIDDYLNILTVSALMKHTTDRLGIPREHLAYTVNSLGASICILVPFSSWSSYAIGCISEYELTWLDYVQSIPYMFFPLIHVFICFLVAIGVIPKLGNLKAAYQKTPLSQPPGNDVPVKARAACRSFILFLLPIATLTAVMLLSDFDIILGLFAALLTQCVLYTIGKLLTVEKLSACILEGFSSMISLCVSVLLGYTLISASNELGFSDYVAARLNAAFPPSCMPVAVFLSVALISWAARNFWVFILLTVPLFIPSAISVGINPHIIIGAIMSGVSFGSLFCFYSDAVFFTAQATGVDNMEQIKTLLPYVLIAFVLAVFLFLSAG